MSRQVSTKRRQLLEGAAMGLGIVLLPMAGRAQTQAPLQAADPAQVQAIVDAFLDGAKPLAQGITLDMPVLGDNPASVPVKVRVDLPMTPQSYCKEIIILAEGNPRPLACRFKFTPLAGSAEVAVRLRLIETQAVQALARMSDGRVLAARQHITVTAGGCGM
ncbi:MAG TPA: thiosulfate oxidation carrier protein SoxY [Pusillimonas sp.]|uniref:thiosulfate oxidation carrier protein SoxY n=1 Tax=Pusillimonas sp. TaxID=3040095 RepID=UPI002C3CC29A|nr:thiosulfate oxidation carrier protein SoxY [Pusillimonas sp.]HUH86659.1 thiosulfate oxidation carrier protein SoxY [Pusillimonas sp.]